MNRRTFFRGIGATLAALPFVKMAVKPTVVKAASLEFTDEEPYGFQPPAISCWTPGQGKPPWTGKPEKGKGKPQG